MRLKRGFKFLPRLQHFILGLLLVSAGVFFTFSHYQRRMFAQRRIQGAQNLTDIGHAIHKLALEHGGRFPESTFEIEERFASEPVKLFSPSWPLQCYIYVFGAQSTDDAARTVLVYENVPGDKRKLGRQVLFLDGGVKVLSESEFEALIAAQQSRRKESGRGAWRTREITK